MGEGGEVMTVGEAGKGGLRALLGPAPPHTLTHGPKRAPRRAHCAGADCCALSTFFTIFCSSMRNARTILQDGKGGD